MLIRSRKDWELPGLQPTSESAYQNRRQILQSMGAGCLSLLGIGGLLARDDATKKAGEALEKAAADWKKKLYPAKRNEAFQLKRKLTDEAWVTSFNNFYEFAFDKRTVKPLAQKMELAPWKITFKGEVEKPLTLDTDDILKKLPLEERLYRFRCVEAWAMAVPWTGIPMRKVLELAKPLASAKYVRFVTFNRPDWGRGFRVPTYEWPYHEALTMSEATNDLTMFVTGLFGKPLPKQNGAPGRLIVPWKYGFKSIKSIVEIEFTKTRPKTFWNTAVPHEYGFFANVDPKVPHPRWSQATEYMIDTRKIVPTQLYNGYGEQVAKLYKKRAK